MASSRYNHNPSISEKLNSLTKEDKMEVASKFLRDNAEIETFKDYPRLSGFMFLGTVINAFNELSERAWERTFYVLPEYRDDKILEDYDCDELPPDIRID